MKQTTLNSLYIKTNSELNIRIELLYAKRMLMYNNMLKNIQKHKDKKLYYINEYKTDVRFIDDEINEIKKELNKRGIKNEKNNKNK